MKYRFANDYSEGAHPRLIEALVKTNETQEDCYEEDQYCVEAAELIKKNIGQLNAGVHFVLSGTQANLIVLSSILKPYESVIATDHAHIHLHETGALEATGHKINVVQSIDGKIRPDQIQNVVNAHNMEHMVNPRVVFISQATELGTIYSKQKLTEISTVCRKNGLYLYLDGARIGSAITSKSNDADFNFIASCVDVFYIGGTKNGALFGEAIVIVNPLLNDHFRFYMKQRGGLLAKSRTLGVQFRELFLDHLYLDLASHANNMAQRLVDGIRTVGMTFLTEPVTNQIFPILPNTVIAMLKQHYGFYEWTKIDETQTAIRLVTSWATTSAAVDEFLNDLQQAITKTGR